ncbi:hypothetical protein AMTR_s00058p00172810, partial [Amborella trichopoda]
QGADWSMGGSRVRSMGCFACIAVSLELGDGRRDEHMWPARFRQRLECTAKFITWWLPFDQEIEQLFDEFRIAWKQTVRDDSEHGPQSLV